MKPFKFLLSAFLLLALVFALALLGYLRYLEKPLSIDAPFVYEVKKGSSSNRVISELHHRGVIEYEVPAKIYVRYEQLDSKLKAGEFSIQKGMTLVELFSLLTSNQHVSYKVSLIEGSTFKEARAVLAGDTR